MGVLSGLSNLGLSKLEDADLFAKDETNVKKQEEPVKQEAKPINEKDFLFDKTIECAVCHKNFTERKVKTGKARLVKQDKDLRPIFNGIDTGKYDVISCPHCGYTALEKWFPIIAAPQAKLVKENISKNFRKFRRDEVVSYDEAIERYRLTLANCIVKRGRDSEKAYTCLKMAWVVRGKAESLDPATEGYDDIIDELKIDEEELLHNAIEGFISARQTENFPIAGMDEMTLDYLLSVLLLKEGKLDESAKFIVNVLQSRSANTRIKNRALEIKEEIIEKKKLTKTN